MIEKLALYSANFFAKKNAYAAEKIPTYKYGFELLISTLINIFFISIISLVTHKTIDILFFCLAFIPLRSAAGGFHAKHHWSCILSFIVVLVGCVTFLKTVSLEISNVYALCLAILSVIIVWKIAPVEPNNKPLSNSQRCTQQKKSRIIVIINLILSLLFFTINIITLKQLFVFYISGAFIASLSLIVAKILEYHSK